MLQRLNAMESELSSLIDGLRTGSNRLNADLQLLEGNFDGVRDAVGPRAQFASEVEPSVSGPLATDVAVAPTEAVVTEVVVVETSEIEVVTESGPAVEELAEDLEGARLVALNMALNGTPREETDNYLAENFDLEDRQLLLDEVYASVAD
jgi:hypothetical protein